MAMLARLFHVWHRVLICLEVLQICTIPVGVLQPSTSTPNPAENGRSVWLEPLLFHAENVKPLESMFLTCIGLHHLIFLG